MDLLELKKHLEESKSNVLVLGDFFSDYKLLNEEEASFMTHKNLIKNTKHFYDIYQEKIYRICEDTDTLKAIRYLIDHYHFNVYLQTTASIGNIGGIRLKGKSDVFYCSKCREHVDLEEMIKRDYMCPTCNKAYRPNVLLGNDKYDIEILKDYDEALQNASTIFLVGFDFAEEELTKQLYIESNKKFNQNGKSVSIFVGETNPKELFEEYSFDFIVNEATDSAMKRLIEKLKAL